MAQGRFRRERALHYAAYARQYAQELGRVAAHRLVLVQNVGHDHTLIFLSPAGLNASFAAFS